MIYNFHPETKEYLNQVQATLDPIESKPLIPSFATTKAPPAVRENEKAVFIDNTWNIIDDYRGLQYWLPNGTNQEIEILGERPPNDALDNPPEPTLEEIRTKALGKVLTFHADARSKVANQADQYKLFIWNDKLQRAIRILTNNDYEADTDILQAECTARGHSETVNQLALIQAEKGQTLAMNLAQISGTEHSAINSIKTATSEKELIHLIRNFK